MHDIYGDQYRHNIDKYGIHDNRRSNNVDGVINQQNEYLKHQMNMANIHSEGEYYAKVSGDYGEYLLSSVMKSLPSEFHVMDNVLLQTKKGSTQLDHVIVSPYGIFIIETKNHKGMIFGDCYGQVWTQVLPSRGRFTFYNPVFQNQGHIQNLANQIKIPIKYFAGIIVFTNDNANLDNVNCQFCIRVTDLYMYLTTQFNPCMTTKQVEDVIKRIDKVDTSSYLNNRKHVEYVKSIQEKKQRNKMIRQMQLRK